MSLYLIAILPPKELSEEINEIRKEISEKYQVFAALKPPVHITLYRPLEIELRQVTYLMKELKPIGYAHSPFVQELENFDSFNNKTMFVHCVKQPLLNKLQKDLSAVIHKNKIDVQESKGNTRFHPHFTIAYRDVSPEVFSALWEEFKNRKLKRRFRIDHFTLLKHDGKTWLPVADFPLQKSIEQTLF